MTVQEFKSSDETKAWAQNFARGRKRPVLVLLSGAMGAGKTQLVRWMAEALGAGSVSSPTFAIHQSYQSSGGSIEHLDLYRVENFAEFESAGLWDLLKDPDSLILIEWPEKLPADIWPADREIINLTIDVLDGEGRKISFTKK